MTEILLFAIVLLASVAALFAVLGFLLSRKLGQRPVLTREDAIVLLRAETDLVRRTNEEQASTLRQELGTSLRNFQDTNLGAFKILREGIDGQVSGFGQRLDSGIKAIDLRANSIASKLDDDLTLTRSEANANRESLRQLVERRLDTSLDTQRTEAKNLREELSTNFQRLGSRVLESVIQTSDHQRERLEKTTAAITEFGEKQERGQETLRSTVESRLDAIRQENATKLDEMRQTVDEKLQSTLETKLGDSFNRVVDQLSLVYKGLGEMKDLATNVGSLKNVLTNVKVRGTFGEVQLSMLLEGFLSPDQYAKDVCVRQHSAERVEYAIKFRVGSEGEEILLPIDAKFPREDYEHLQQASEAGDTLLVARFRKQLENRIKTCARDIRTKYINPPYTTEFAILFLPTESLYAEVLRQPGLFEHLQRECRVTLAGPTTFAAILHAFQMNFRSLAIAKRSSEVWNILGAVRTEFTKYNDVVERLGKQLNTAATSVENLGRRTRAMTKTLKRVEVFPDQATAENVLGLASGDVLGDDEEADLLGNDEPPMVPQARAVA